MTTLDNLRDELLTKKPRRPDPRSLNRSIEDSTKALQAATPAPADVERTPASPEPPAQKLGLTPAQLHWMRFDQRMRGTKFLYERYKPEVVAEFLASSYNLYSAKPPAAAPVAPQTIEEIAATHIHRSCDCEICGVLLNAGYRVLTDDSGQRVTWKSMAAPHVEAPKLEKPLYPPEEMLTPHLKEGPPFCQSGLYCSYGCRDKFEALVKEHYWHPETRRWQRLGGGS
jgi:hypothetical protein